MAPKSPLGTPSIQRQTSSDSDLLRADPPFSRGRDPRGSLEGRSGPGSTGSEPVCTSRGSGRDSGRSGRNSSGSGHGGGRVAARPNSLWGSSSSTTTHAAVLSVVTSPAADGVDAASNAGSNPGQPDTAAGESNTNDVARPSTEGGSSPAAPVSAESRRSTHSRGITQSGSWLPARENLKRILSFRKVQLVGQRVERARRGTAAARARAETTPRTMPNTSTRSRQQQCSTNIRAGTGQMYSDELGGLDLPVDPPPPSNWAISDRAANIGDQAANQVDANRRQGIVMVNGRGDVPAGVNRYRGNLIRNLQVRNLQAQNPLAQVIQPERPWYQRLPALALLLQTTLLIAYAIYTETSRIPQELDHNPPSGATPPPEGLPNTCSLSFDQTNFSMPAPNQVMGNFGSFLNQTVGTNVSFLTTVLRPDSGVMELVATGAPALLSNFLTNLTPIGIRVFQLPVELHLGSRAFRFKLTLFYPETAPDACPPSLCTASPALAPPPGPVTAASPPLSAPTPALRPAPASPPSLAPPPLFAPPPPRPTAPPPPFSSPRCPDPAAPPPAFGLPPELPIPNTWTVSCIQQSRGSLFPNPQPAWGSLASTIECTARAIPLDWRGGATTACLIAPNFPNPWRPVNLDPNHWSGPCRGVSDLGRQTLSLVNTLACCFLIYLKSEGPSANGTICMSPDLCSTDGEMEISQYIIPT